MKKFVKVFPILIASAIIGYWGYKQLTKKSSLLGKIHLEADSAVKIGFQEIKETLVLDALSSPGYYYERAKISTSDDDDEPYSGIDLLPYNLVFYTLPEVDNTLFGTLKIKDSKAFESFIAKELAKKSTTVQEASKKDYRFATIEKSRIALGWNTEKLVIALSPKLRPNQFQRVFKDVLTEGNTITDDDNPLIKALAEHDDHLVFIKGDGHATINFEDGRAVLDGSLRTESAQKFQQEINTEAVADASLQMYFDSNFENEKNRQEVIGALAEASFFKKNNLEIADIIDRTNGFMSVAIAGRTTQTDTIITYGYDDNFEKVAERSVQERQVPKIHMNLGAANESLTDYLRAKKAIDESGIFGPFPLYTVHVKDGSMQTSFDTYQGLTSAQKQLSSSFFGCQIDFEKLYADLNLPMLKSYIENLKKMELFASQKEGNRIELYGELTSSEPDINILSQLAMKKRLDSVH